MVRDPVQRRHAHHAVHRLVHLEPLAQVRLPQPDPVRVRRQGRGRGGEHLWRAVQGDQPAARVLGEQHRGVAPGAAAELQDGLTGDRVESVEDASAPADVGQGQGAVRGSVPVARCGSGHDADCGGSAALLHNRCPPQLSSLCSRRAPANRRASAHLSSPRSRRAPAQPPRPHGDAAHRRAAAEWGRGGVLNSRRLCGRDHCAVVTTVRS
ncbi:hypothetical protein SDC9_178656 [bioreactor metagenome]|uniref:Uncharacterized protein n=1 Tax=bioreactor metagenome TaxID=1076179 RepID=A0A645GYQ1_9ZZZZ